MNVCFLKRQAQVIWLQFSEKKLLAIFKTSAPIESLFIVKNIKCYFKKQKLLTFF